MYFGKIVQLFTDDTKIYLTSENEEVIEVKMAKEFKKNRLAAWLEVVKIEPLNAYEVEIQYK